MSPARRPSPTTVRMGCILTRATRGKEAPRFFHPEARTHARNLKHLMEIARVHHEIEKLRGEERARATIEALMDIGRIRGRNRTRVLEAFEEVVIRDGARTGFSVGEEEVLSIIRRVAPSEGGPLSTPLTIGLHNALEDWRRTEDLKAR